MSISISILIPTYDYKCYTLVSDIQKQLADAEVYYEIIVSDDGGRDQVINISNLRINELPNCKYIHNKQNVGRAYNCNNLIKMAKYDWCLIMDCDAKVVRNDFIAKYIEGIKDNSNIDIFSGDLVNPDALPSPEVTLRYNYEKAAEPKRTVSFRSQQPFRRFTTFNVLIRRSVLLEIPFDEDCTEYGWEDALMGIEFEKHGKTIMHIDNPLMHLGFDKNSVYLKKVETSLRTLNKLGDKMIPYTSIGRVVEKLKGLYLLWFVQLFYIVFKPLLLKNLLGNKPNIKVFEFYKLGYFISLR